MTDVGIDTPRQAQIRAVAAHCLSEQLYLSHIISSAILATNVDTPPTSATEGDRSDAPVGHAPTAPSTPVVTRARAHPETPTRRGRGRTRTSSETAMSSPRVIPNKTLQRPSRQAQCIWEAVSPRSI